MPLLRWDPILQDVRQSDTGHTQPDHPTVSRPAKRECKFKARMNNGILELNLPSSPAQ